MITTTVEDRRKKGRPVRIDYSALLSESSVKRWIQFAELREQTQKSYIWHLRDFLVRYAVPRLGLSESADKFLEWAKSQKDLDNVLLAVVDFGEHYNPLYSVQKVVNILRSFLHWNRLDLPPKKQRTRIKSWHRGYTRQEMQSLLGFLDSPNQKLYEYVAKDSFLRMSAILRIRYRHIRKDLENGKDGFCAIRFEPEFYLSSKSAGVNFLGPESVQFIKDKITRWDPSTRTFQPVFMDGKLNVDPEALLFDFDDSTISESLTIAKRKAKIPEEVQPSHGFRKFSDNAILKMEDVMPQEIKNLLMGHSIGVEWHYHEPDVGEGGKLREWYKKLYPLLDLSEQGAIKREFGQQTEYIRGLEDKISVLESRDQRFEDAKAEWRKELDKIRADFKAEIEHLKSQ